MSCCFSTCVVAVKIVNVGRVYMEAKMLEVLGIEDIRTSFGFFKAFRLTSERLQESKRSPVAHLS